MVLHCWHNNITLLQLYYITDSTSAYILTWMALYYWHQITLLTQHHITDLLNYSHNITTLLQWYHITDSKSSPYWQDIITSLWPWSDNYWNQTETASSHPHLHCVRLSASTNQNSVKLILNSFSLKTCQTDQQPHLRPNRWQPLMRWDAQGMRTNPIRTGQQQKQGTQAATEKRDHQRFVPIHTHVHLQQERVCLLWLGNPAVEE